LSSSTRSSESSKQARAIRDQWFSLAYLEALAVVFPAPGLVAGAALAMHPLLCRQRVVFGPGRAELRLEPQLGVLLHEGSPVLAVPAALAVAGVRAEKVALEALAVAATARTKGGEF